MRKFFLVLIFLIALAGPMLAQAQAQPCTKVPDVPITPQELPQCINQIYVWSLGAAAIAAFLMMVVGAYYYMTAAGNAERSGKGTQILWSSVIGLVLLFGAYLLLNTINPQLVEFKSFSNDFTCLTNPAAKGCPQPPADGTRK